MASEALAYHEVGLRKAPLGVAALDVLMVDDVVAPLGVQKRRARPQRLLGVDHHWQRLVVDIDQFHRVFEQVLVASHHSDHRLAHVINLVRRQRPVQRPFGLAG
jgi:hypothetical protein